MNKFQRFILAVTPVVLVVLVLQLEIEYIIKILGEEYISYVRLFFLVLLIIHNFISIKLRDKEEEVPLLKISFKGLNSLSIDFKQTNPWGVILWCTLIYYLTQMILKI